MPDSKTKTTALRRKASECLIGTAYRLTTDEAGRVIIDTSAPVAAETLAAEIRGSDDNAR